MLAWIPPPAPRAPAADETPSDAAARERADAEDLLRVRAGAFRLCEILTTLVTPPKTGKVSARRRAR